MTGISLLTVLLLGSSVPTICAPTASSLPFQIGTSAKQYGPDGPWQAIQVTIGFSRFNNASNSDQEPIDLYPGGVFESTIISSQACLQSSKICGAGGVFNPANSISLYDTGFSSWLDIPHNYVNLTYVLDQMTFFGVSGSLQEPIVVGNVSMCLVTQMNMSLPTGTLNPLQLGTLSLGPTADYFVPEHYTGPPVALDGSDGYSSSFNYNGIDVNASLIPNSIAALGDIPSASYGLHIGSATLKIPLSLWIGGYDQSRIVGDVSAQEVSPTFSLDIDLLDIGIGVESGTYADSALPRDGLLSRGNASIGSSIQVSMDPLNPYLYLPRSTCLAIADYLPITYQADYDLYLWNTKEALYTHLVTSRSYLNFTFRSTPASNITINVPFALLNLTLDDPIVTSPSAYFPCQAPKFGPQQYSLGRAFLQAAFFGVDWDTNPTQWYLAQAPGPDIALASSQVPFNGTPVADPNVTWSETWLFPNSADSSDEPNSPSHSLSAGGEAGTTLGLFGFFLAVVLFLARCRKRRRARMRKSTETEKQEQAAMFPDIISSSGGGGGTPAIEMDASPAHKAAADEVFEAPGSQPAERRSGPGGQAYELVGSPVSPEGTPRSVDYLLPSMEFSPVVGSSSLWSSEESGGSEEESKGASPPVATTVRECGQ